MGIVRAHPIDPRVVLTAGDDGHVILWDIVAGKILWKWVNRHPGGQVLEQSFMPGDPVCTHAMHACNTHMQCTHAMHTQN